MPLLCCSVIPLGKCPFQSFYATTPKSSPVTKTVLQSLWAALLQENFLLSTSGGKNLQSTDLSLAVGQWLANPQNNLQVTQVIQQTVPKVFEFVGQEQIGRFIQSNSVQWVRNTQVNHLASEMLRAVLENDFHQDVLQRGLDLAHDWMLNILKKAVN